MGNTAVAVRLSATDRIEQVGVVSFFAMAGVLQFSIAAAQILLAISIACWFALLASGRERFAAPRFFWLLVGYGACTLVSAAFSPDIRHSLMECKQLVLFLIVPLAYSFVKGNRGLTLMTVILTFAAISAALGIFEYGILHYDDLHRRVQGTLGHYMTYSGLLMLVIGVALARVLFGDGERTWAALVMPALVVAVALTFTRTAVVGACAAAALLLSMKDFRLLAALPVVAALFIVFAPGKVNARVASIFDMNDPTNRDRIAMMREGAHMIAAHPLVGVGPNMVQPLYAQYRDPSAVEKVNPHLHDVPLQIAAERGLPALAIWLSFIVVLVVDLARRYRASDERFLAAAGLAAVAAMLAAGFFENNFGDSEFLMLFLILVTVPFAAWRDAHA
jgi:putative inorganic carbon (hco3(-)) transporter